MPSERTNTLGLSPWLVEGIRPCAGGGRYTFYTIASNTCLLTHSSSCHIHQRVINSGELALRKGTGGGEDGRGGGSVPWSALGSAITRFHSNGCSSVRVCNTASCKSHCTIVGFSGVSPQLPPSAGAPCIAMCLLPKLGTLMNQARIFNGRLAMHPWHLLLLGVTAAASDVHPGERLRPRYHFTPRFGWTNGT